MNHRPLRPAVLALVAALLDPATSGAQSLPELVVGPARVGETVSYRVTVAEEGVAEGDAAPRTGTVTITWKSRTRYLARVGSDSSSVVLARGAGGTLAVENMNPHDAGMVELSAYLAYFERTDDLVAAVAHDGSGEAVLHVDPAQPRAPARRPVDVPVSVTRTRRGDGLSIDAIGTVKQLSATTHVEASAQFDAAGTLTHESWHESTTEVPARDGTRTIRRTVTIDIVR